MLEVCKKGPPFEPKFIFYKTKSWKKIDKESQKSFEFFIKTFKKILKYLIPLHILKRYQNIIKLFMKQIWLIIFKLIIKNQKKTF